MNLKTKMDVHGRHGRTRKKETLKNLENTDLAVRRDGDSIWLPCFSESSVDISSPFPE